MKKLLGWIRKMIAVKQEKPRQFGGKSFGDSQRMAALRFYGKRDE